MIRTAKSVSMILVLRFSGSTRRGGLFRSRELIFRYVL